MSKEHSNTSFEAHTASIEELRWADVRDSIATINAELADIVDYLKPSDDLTLFRAKYPFGTKISDHGILHIPNSNGNIVPIYDDSIPKNTRDKLSYNPIPLSLVTKNNSEVFTISDNRLIPLKIFEPGELFGTWELLDPEPFKQQAYNWSFSAGARSIFMLPKIADAYSHSRLRSKYGVSLSTPKYLSDHHEIFAKIANHRTFPYKWHNEIIFFSDKWLNNLSQRSNIKWTALYFLILKAAWNQFLNWRSQITTELIWQSLSEEMSRRNMHTRNYLVNTVKHLITLGIGTTPAFVPATTEDSAPINGLQTAYIDDYKLKYNPTIMIPASLNFANHTTSENIYYSLQDPSLLTYTKSASHSRSAMKDLQDIKYLLDALLDRLKNDMPPTYKLVNNLNFEYFHTEIDQYGDIIPSKDISIEDSRFIHCGNDKGDTLPFSDSASFLRGCIRISRSYT